MPQIHSFEAAGVPPQEYSVLWFDEQALAGFADEACEILRHSNHANDGQRLDFIRQGIIRLQTLVSDYVRIQR